MKYVINNVCIFYNPLRLRYRVWFSENLSTLANGHKNKNKKQTSQLSERQENFFKCVKVSFICKKKHHKQYCIFN